MNLKLKSFVKEDDIIMKDPNPKMNADLDTSLHVTKSTVGEEWAFDHLIIHNIFIYIYKY